LACGIPKPKVVSFAFVLHIAAVVVEHGRHVPQWRKRIRIMKVMNW
jgi:hypothetical protein